MRKLVIDIYPLAAWVTMAGALVTQLPLRLEQLWLILGAAAVLSLPWLPPSRRRSGALLLAYVALAWLALVVAWPPPADWHVLTRLAVPLLLWTAVTTIAVGCIIYYLLHTAGRQNNSP